MSIVIIAYATGVLAGIWVGSGTSAARTGIHPPRLRSSDEVLESHSGRASSTGRVRRRCGLRGCGYPRVVEEPMSKDPVYERTREQRDHWKEIATIEAAMLDAFKARIYRALTDNPEKLTINDLQDLCRTGAK